MIVKDTIITLANGVRKKIDWLVDSRKQDITYRALTYNISEQKRENKTINAFIKQENNQKIITLLVKSMNQMLILNCTDDHQIFSKDKNTYVKVNELEENDKVVTWVNNEINEGIIFKKVYNPQKIEYVYDLDIEDNNNMFANGILVLN